MTDRKPDIITKWSIKENTDATYTARCATMPNVELTADNVVVILGKIEGFLRTMYRDTTVDGGITGINAEYNVTKRQEMSLDTFDTKDTADSVKAQLLDIGKQLLESEDGLKALDNGGVTVNISEMPTDDPTPEPATDAPELHEEPCIKPLDEKHTCVDCARFQYCAKTREGDEGHETCDDFTPASRLTTPIPQKKPRKPRAKKQKKEEVKEDGKKCSSCRFLSDHNQCLCPPSPNYGSKMNPDYFISCEHHETQEQFEKAHAGYKWHRITMLEAGCEQCAQLKNGTCKGTNDEIYCDKYHPRDDSGEECRTCKKLGGKLGYQQDGKDAYMCDHHKQPICLDDLCCYAYKRR